MPRYTIPCFPHHGLSSLALIVAHDAAATAERPAKEGRLHSRKLHLASWKVVCYLLLRDPATAPEQDHRVGIERRYLPKSMRQTEVQGDRATSC